MAEPFRTISADPPWRFKDRLPGKSRGAAKNYSTMSVEQIKAYLPGLGLPIADDALLFLWRVSSMVEEAYAVARAWGFEPKSEIVWVKIERSGIRHFGMGRYVRNSHESCLIARRGKSIIRSHSVKSVFEGVIGAHSAKPWNFFPMVEKLAPGPYLELFARERRKGWTSIGDELPSVEAAE
jgi:N6-adenosine-specific RNA methylase IME4